MKKKRNKFSRLLRDKTNAMHVLVTSAVKSELPTHPEVGTAACEEIYFSVPSREEVEAVEPDKWDDRYHFDELQADDERGFKN